MFACSAHSQEDPASWEIHIHMCYADDRLKMPWFMSNMTKNLASGDSQK